MTRGTPVVASQRRRAVSETKLPSWPACCRPPQRAGSRCLNLPARAIIRIYSVSGVLVSVIAHDDPAGGGEATWNLRNRNNQFVASGVYFYHVEAPDGKTKIGRFTVVNFAP